MTTKYANIDERLSGYDPTTGICCDFRNKGDCKPHLYCKCPAHTNKERVNALFGRCRSGKRWFWVLKLFLSEPAANGFTNTESEAMSAAMAAACSIFDGRPGCASVAHGLTSDTLKDANKAKRLVRPAPNTSGARNGVAVAFFDPQHRGVLNRLKYGNEGARQKERHALPAMTDSYIEQCCRDIARTLQPSGYLFLWVDTFRLCRGDHLHVDDVLPPVDLIAWDNGRPGMGYRSRRRGDCLLVLQRPPLRAKETWHDHSIPSRWTEKVDRRIHPHIKPAGLIGRLIAAVTKTGDLVIDPAAGSFTVMHVAHELGRRFIGCDLRAGDESEEATR